MAAYSNVAKTGYQNFGSFFTESVEDMIAVPQERYSPPPLPFEQASLEHLADLTDLGEPCRPLFMVDFQGWTFVNHGAFGAVCRAAHEEANQWREHCELQPLRFMDRELFPHMVRVMREVAHFVHASPQDLVFVPNATTGLNVAIRAAGLKPGDALYMLNIGYGSVKKMAQAAAASVAPAAPRADSDSESPGWAGTLDAASGIDVVYGDVTFPISGPQDIVELVARTMPPHTKLAVFDSVTSNTALVLPVAELVQLCKGRGVQVLVDGAHALGQLEMDLQQLDADYFVTNCHKWLCAPRGSALLWVAPRRKAAVRPLVVSHGSGCGFTSDFIWDGCRDYAPYLATSSALRLWQAIGPQRIRTYMRGLLAQAVALLTSRWHTAMLAPSLAMCGSMALVGLPHDLFGPEEPRPGQATSTEAKYVQDLLHHVAHVECPVKCIQGTLYVRISCHIYNTLADYELLAEEVEDIRLHEDPSAEGRCCCHGVHGPSLTFSLDLSWCYPRQGGGLARVCAMLRAATQLSGLQELDLSGNQLHTEPQCSAVTAALAAARHLSSLRAVVLDHGPLTRPEACASLLRAAAHLHGLTRLAVDCARLTTADVAELQSWRCCRACAAYASQRSPAGRCPRPAWTRWWAPSCRAPRACTSCRSCRSTSVARAFQGAATSWIQCCRACWARCCWWHSRACQASKPCG